MEQAMRALDFEAIIGKVKLCDGTELDIPKLSMRKIIQIVKFLGVDGVRLYDQYRNILLDDTCSDLEKLSILLDQLREEELIRILSILLDISDEMALQLDLNEVLDVLLVYAEKTNLSKTFTQVQKLMKKMTGRDIPDLKTLLDSLFAPIEENQVSDKAKAGQKSSK